MMLTSCYLILVSCYKKTPVKYRSPTQHHLQTSNLGICVNFYLWLVISKKAKYAIHALVRLAREHHTGPVMTATIAETEHIPKKFLEAILLDLKKAGFVASKQGRSGGYYLIKEPTEINLADIHRVIDGAIALLPCVTYKYYQRCDECTDEETCGIRQVMQNVRDETVSILKACSLQDIINTENGLEAALGRHHSDA